MSETQSLMDESLKLYQASDFAGAAKSLQDLVEQDSRNFDAWRMLGFALNGAGEHDRAIKAFQAAIQINFRDADVHYGLGMAHQALGDHRAAIASFEKCLHENSHHPAAKIPAADSYEKIGKEMEEALNLLGAEQYYEKAYQYSQREDYYRKLLEYYDRAGQGGKAMLVEREWRARHGETEPEDVSMTANSIPDAAPDPAQPMQMPSGMSDPNASPAKPASSSTYSCPACHKPMAMTVNICPNCGHDTRQPVNMQGSGQKGKANESKPGFFSRLFGGKSDRND